MSLEDWIVVGSFVFIPVVVKHFSGLSVVVSVMSLRRLLV